VKLFVFPGNLEPEIRRLGAEEVPYARTDAFGGLVHRCHRQLAELAGTADGSVLSFTSSGTGAVEALLAGWGPQWRRLLVLHAGTFGRRWFDMSAHLGLAAEEVCWPPHHDPPWQQIEAALASGRHDAVMAVHHETSTGELIDLARLGALCRAAPVHLLVDAIGSFLADPFSMDEWNVAAAVTSSQKGLCLPPGLAFLITRPTLGPPAGRSLSYYFNPRSHLESFVRGQPLWSPAAQIYRQLDQRLDTISKSGGAAHALAAVAEKARAFRDALAADGWSPAARHPSQCLTALRFNQPAGPLVRTLAEDDWFVLPSADPSLVRIAHLGMAGIEDHRALARHLVHHATRLGLGTPVPS
jgi:aspartate aminotransferase-like enzyme